MDQWGEKRWNFKIMPIPVIWKLISKFSNCFSAHISVWRVWLRRPDRRDLWKLHRIPSKLLVRLLRTDRRLSGKNRWWLCWLPRFSLLRIFGQRKFTCCRYWYYLFPLTPLAFFTPRLNCRFIFCSCRSGQLKIKTNHKRIWKKYTFTNESLIFELEESGLQ